MKMQQKKGKENWIKKLNYVIIFREDFQTLYVGCQGWSQRYTKVKNHFQDVNT